MPPTIPMCCTATAKGSQNGRLTCPYVGDGAGHAPTTGSPRLAPPDHDPPSSLHGNEPARGLVAEHGPDLARTPTVLYAVNLLMAATAYWILGLTIKGLPGDGQRYREAVGSHGKEHLSTSL